MCGLCGIYHPGTVISQTTIERMTQAIHHRGPDGKGLWVSKGIALGHRRLSIIDIEGGHQPWISDDKRVHLVFNGEIYNYIELRKTLIHHGHTFHSSSDTEVLLKAYEHWGVDCVDHLNGIFAFAIWDAQKQQLFLARDHLGVKPLYYSEIGGSLIFASEIKSLLQYENCPRAIDLDSLALLFTFRFVPSPGTLFSGIHKLPPGYRLIAGSTGITIQRYWNWKPVIRSRWNETELIREYQSLLQESVTRQLRSDVPVGLFLSSGVDSASLLALMSEHGNAPIKTYTIGFSGGEKTSEIADARELSNHYGAEHHIRIINSQDYLDYFERYMQDIEEPVAHEPAPAFYFLAGLAAKDVKVVLSGQGADEPWAGYDRYIGVKLSSWYSRLPSGLTHCLAASVNHIPFPLEKLKRGLVSLSTPDLIERFMKIYSFFSDEVKHKLYEKKLLDGFTDHHRHSREVLGKLQVDVCHLDPLSQMLYIDTRANLPDDLLMVADKTSMAHSLEVRVPFLDYRLIEFIETLPPQLKLRFLTGKYLHKKSVEKWVPRNVVYRRKKGFSHPVDLWLRSSLKPLIQDLVLGPNSPLTPYFNRSQMLQMYELYLARREPYMRHFYLLLSLALWLRCYNI